MFSPSHPTRGAWIETNDRIIVNYILRSHPTRGAWIETCVYFQSRNSGCRRTLRGVRGLKQNLSQYVFRVYESHPTRGAWIETILEGEIGLSVWPHPTRGAWIETNQSAYG